MKNLIIPIVIAFILFCIGCQENSITDPVVNESVDKVQLGNPDTRFSGTINLNHVLDDPYPTGNSFFRINGQVEYSLRKIILNSAYLEKKPHLTLHLETDADLRYFCTVCPPSPEDNLSGFISEMSDSYVDIGGNNVSILNKKYKIDGRKDEMELNMQFSVSNDKIELIKMWLALPTGYAITTEK